MRRLATAAIWGLAFLVVCGPMARAAVAEGEHVTWMDIDFAPFYIHQGAQSGQGIADRLTRLLVSGLSDLEHRHATGSPTRIQRSLEAGEKVCSASFLKNPEREKVMTFSTEALFLPPNGVTVRKDSMPFQGVATVSLKTLLEDPTLRLGVAQGRAYGPELDELLLFHRGDNVTQRQGQDIYEGLLGMLLRGRVDWILGYPYESVYVAESLGVMGQIKNLQLAESPGYIYAYVVCPPTDWGRALIQRIDRILVDHRESDEHRSFVGRWLDEKSREAYAAAYTRAFETEVTAGGLDSEAP